jgi:hypothetical protein
LTQKSLIGLHAITIYDSFTAILYRSHHHTINGLNASFNSCIVYSCTPYRAVQKWLLQPLYGHKCHMMYLHRFHADVWGTVHRTHIPCFQPHSYLPLISSPSPFSLTMKPQISPFLLSMPCRSVNIHAPGSHYLDNRCSTSCTSCMGLTVWTAPLLGST